MRVKPLFFSLFRGSKKKIISGSLSSCGGSCNGIIMCVKYVLRSGLGLFFSFWEIRLGVILIWWVVEVEWWVVRLVDG